MLSLRQQLGWVPGEGGISVNPPEVFEVNFSEFPTNADELEQLLGSVQEWLDESGLESLTVTTPDEAYTLRPKRL
jgi:hypothetical protein